MQIFRGRVVFRRSDWLGDIVRLYMCVRGWAGIFNRADRARRKCCSLFFSQVVLMPSYIRHLSVSPNSDIILTSFGHIIHCETSIKLIYYLKEYKRDIKLVSKNGIFISSKLSKKCSHSYFSILNNLNIGLIRSIDALNMDF